MVAGTAASFLGGTCAFWLGRRLDHGGLEKIHWLHLTRDRLRWPERFFKRHGAKTVFVGRFIFLFPPVVVNLLAGMSKIPWRTFPFFNLAGSASQATGYILIGYLFGKKWKLLQAWLGPMTLYLILTGGVLLVLGVIFRHSVIGSWARLFSIRRQRK